MRPRANLLLLGASLVATLLTVGCSSMTPAGRAVGVLTTVGSLTPNADIEQTYYLGSFDPRSQLPPSIYRVRVRGQASLFSGTRFASSWMPAEVVDSLTGSIDPASGRGDIRISSDPAHKVSLQGAGRSLVLFGPEGFREAPRGHRLVILMGSNPDAVEQALTSALGTVASVRFGQSGAAVDRSAFALLLELSHERDRLKALAAAP